MSWLDDEDLDPDSDAGRERMMGALHAEQDDAPGIMAAAPTAAPPAPEKSVLLRIGGLVVFLPRGDDAGDAEAEALRDVSASGGSCVLVRLPQLLGWGAGDHATTRLMCHWLQTRPVMQALELGGRLCDFGCGSGVLSLAATALVPSATACGVDIEPNSVRCSRVNAHANGLESRCTFHLPPASFLEHDLDFFARFGHHRDHAAELLPEGAGGFHVVVANILPGPLARLAPTLLHLLAPGGLLALAGCQSHQVQELVDRYEHYICICIYIATYLSIPLSICIVCR